MPGRGPLEPVLSPSRRVRRPADVDLHVIVHDDDGPGVPVLALHGLGATARLWDAVGTRLAALGHPVAALDLRGHGRSSSPGAGADFATLADDVVAVARDLGWQPGSDRRPVLAGHGWGANVALEVAVRCPDAVRASVWVDGGTIELTGRFADWPTARVALAPSPLAGRPAARFEAGLRARYPDWPEAALAGLLADVEVLADGTVRPWLDPADHRAFLQQLWGHHPPRRYPLVPTPVTVVPAEDPEVPDARFMTVKRAEVAAATAGLPHATVRWIRGDHALPAEQPDVVAEVIHGAAGAGAPPAHR